MFKLHEFDNIIIAELTDEDLIISQSQDALDLMAEAGTFASSGIIIQEKNLHADFFRLPSGLAGEILQKISNYRFKLAIVGDFSKYESKNLQDFIRESNKGNSVFFLNNIGEALCTIAKK
jgi:hypothetical protein